MNITEKDLIGEIKDFPIEVVEKMIERQMEQGNVADVRVFQEYCKASNDGHGLYWRDTIEGYKFCGHGFRWNDTIEGLEFWNSVIIEKNFEVFFEKYPKKEEDCWIDPKGRRMLVWDNYEEEANERIVIAKLPPEAKQQYVTVSGLCENKFKKGEEYITMSWKNAKPIPQKTKLSLSTIAEKFGLSVDEIEIDFDK